MDYFLDLFTPATWIAFRDSGGEVTGFRPTQRRAAKERVHQGDLLLCYLTRLSRWCGALRVESDMYEDDQVIFDDPDPFTIRFKVKPIVILQPEYAIPIHEDKIWNSLSTTKLYDKSGSNWTGFFRSSLNKFSAEDGDFILDLAIIFLTAQSAKKIQLLFVSLFSSSPLISFTPLLMCATSSCNWATAPFFPSISVNCPMSH